MTEQPEVPEQDDVVAAAAAERRPIPRTDAEAADLQDKYDRMMRLAALFDDVGEEMRQRSRLGTEIVADPAFADSASLSTSTHARAEEDVLAATTGRRGLLTRSVELDADALVVRATVLTYRWIDELQEAAYQTLGSIAGRAIGYLAPEVALGGAIVSAGLIETDVLDRDGVTAYLDELADANPELMEHVASGGGGLLDGLQMRSLLTAGVLAGESGRAAAPGGLRAIGVPPLAGGIDAAVRDVAGEVVAEADPAATVATDDGAAPASLAELMGSVGRATAAVVVRRVAPGRFVCLLPGPGHASDGRRLRLVGGDTGSYGDDVVRAIEEAVDANRAAGERPHVMLVGTSYGGVAAAEIAAAVGGSMTFVVDQVVTAGAPSAHVPRIPEGTRVLALEDRSDPAALLGSLMNAGAGNRVTVVYDAAAVTDGEDPYVAGGRAADRADNPDLRAELDRLRELGYLA
jgi:hypothetical protein